MVRVRRPAPSILAIEISGDGSRLPIRLMELKGMPIIRGTATVGIRAGKAVR